MSKNKVPTESLEYFLNLIFLELLGHIILNCILLSLLIFQLSSDIPVVLK